MNERHIALNIKDGLVTEAEGAVRTEATPESFTALVNNAMEAAFDHGRGMHHNAPVKRQAVLDAFASVCATPTMPKNLYTTEDTAFAYQRGWNREVWRNERWERTEATKAEPVGVVSRWHGDPKVVWTGGIAPDHGTKLYLAAQQPASTESDLRREAITGPDGCTCIAQGEPSWCHYESCPLYEPLTASTEAEPIRAAYEAGPNSREWHSAVTNAAAEVMAQKAALREAPADDAVREAFEQKYRAEWGDEAVVRVGEEYTTDMANEAWDHWQDCVAALADRQRTTPETPTDPKAVELPPLPMLPIVVSHPGAIYGVMQQYARNAVALNARAESQAAVFEVLRIDRLMHAIESECDGLAIEAKTARAILDYVDTGGAESQAAGAEKIVDYKNVNGEYLEPIYAAPKVPHDR